MGLEEIRAEIDGIDRKIIGLLSQRGGLVSAAGRLKKNEKEVRAPERVRKVIDNARAEAEKSDLSPDIAERVFKTITGCFVNMELAEINLAGKARFFSKDDLPLKPNVPGAMMWAIALERSMLTYFELAPKTVFPEHSHVAEQITMVLEGELTLLSGTNSFTLGPGDVIAIPSNLKHSATTGNVPCRAVDAWSPPREDFIR